MGELFLKNVVSLVAVAVSIAAIAIALVYKEPLTTDWLGVLVGILSLIVMLLIGWNIWNIVEFKNKVKHIVKEEVSSSNQKLLDEVNSSTFLALYNIGLSMMAMNYYVEAISLFIKAAILIENPNNTTDNINPCIDYVLTCMIHIKNGNSKDSSMEKELKDVCIRQLAKLEHKNTSEIISFIVSLPDEL